jgi:hypothetical protein
MNKLAGRKIRCAGVIVREFAFNQPLDGKAVDEAMDTASSGAGRSDNRAEFIKSGMR